MLRLSVTAKEFGGRPSDYLPELGSYEKFCVDEICAHLMIHLREEAREQAQSESNVSRELRSKGPVSLNWLMDEQKRRDGTG
jgi:hypothetical protein